jgi:hypothetical protein
MVTSFINSLLDDYMCKIHYIDLQEKDVIFDVDSHVKKLTQNAPKGTFWKADTKRIVETYWFHVHMSVKYFMRKDFFKTERCIAYPNGCTYITVTE